MTPRERRLLTTKPPREIARAAAVVVAEGWFGGMRPVGFQGLPFQRNEANRKPCKVHGRLDRCWRKPVGGSQIRPAAPGGTI